MAPRSTTRRKISPLLAACCALDDLLWIDRVLLGKATRKPGGLKLPSVLTEDGFIRAMLREANLLRQEVGVVAGDPRFRRAVRARTGLNWPRATSAERSKAVTELANLIRSMPSQFAPGVRVVLDEQGKIVVDETHRDLGRKYSELTVDPVFSLRNERAVAAIRESTSIFFSEEYERQADRFRERAQATISSGLDQGLGREEIARDLGNEFSSHAANEHYWETVAAVHVNRARSFSSVATYASSGITQYEVVAVGDERTTPICIEMDGRILGVEPAMDSFDALEGATSLEDVKNRAAPFLQMREGNVVTRGGAQVGSLSGEKLNSAGIHTPPYHFRCRSTTIPVLDSATVIPGAGAKDIDPGEAPPPPREEPKKPKKPRTRAPKKPKDDRLVDPLAAAKTPASRRKAILDQIKDGRGFVPGSLSSISKIAKTDSDLDKLNTKMAEAFRARGRAVIAGDPDLMKLWNSAVKNRGPNESWAERTRLIRGVLEKGKTLGLEAIPEKDRAKRREKFVKAVLKKTKPGRRTGSTFTAYNGPRGKLSAHEATSVEAWAGEFFDSWGPAAEAALDRNKRLIKAWGRAHNNQTSQYFSFRSREVFHHEFGHSIEHHANIPRGKNEKFNRSTGKRESFWRHRVETRDTGPGRRLKDIFPGSGYDDWERSKEDKWAEAYMGKTYSRGSTEIVSMLSQGYGGDTALWAKQFTDDPDVLLEFLGYQESLARGEETRQARLKAASRKK